MEKIEIKSKAEYLAVLSKIAGSVHGFSPTVLGLSRCCNNIAVFESSIPYSGFSQREVEISMKLKNIAQNASLLSGYIYDLQSILDKELKQ